MRSRAFVLVSALVAALPAQAQETSSGLSGLLLRFFSPSNPVVLAGNPNPAFSHAAHFVSQPAAQGTLNQLNRGIAQQLSTFPLGSSSAGFTYTFDASVGVFQRNTETFGPIFAERPLTAGKGKFSFGVNHLNATYDTFEGRDLGDGTGIQLFLTHQDTDSGGSNLTPWFEGDIIRADLRVDLENQTSVLYANYGVTDKLDIGVALPFVRLTMNAAIDTSIERLSTSVDPFVIHQFEDGSISRTYTESGDAEGLGDMVIRAKYNLFNKASSSMALAADLRLPTGDEQDLLGAGVTQAKLYAILGGGSGRFSPRASVGYTFSSGTGEVIGQLPNEFDYTVGFDLAPHSRVTLTADLLGRLQFDAERLVLEDETFNFVLRTDPTLRTTTRQTPATAFDNANLLLGSAGIKINPFGRLLLVGNVLFGIGDTGLQDKVTPVFGIDYTF